MSSYDPNSTDSTLSQILTRLQQQDTASATHRTEVKEFMAEIRLELNRYAAKFESADREKWYQRGFVAAITVATSAAWAWWTSGHSK